MKYTYAGPAPTTVKFVYENPMVKSVSNSSPEWYAIVDNSANSKSMITNYATNPGSLVSGSGRAYFTPPGQLAAVPFNNIVTTLLTDMSSFINVATFNQNIRAWDTSNVTNMSSMFEGATTFAVAITPWNTSKVTSMSSMFKGASVFNQPINYNSTTGAWNTAKVSNMFQMFWNASAFNGNISSWNTSNVTTMYSMFNTATAFNGNISAWNTANVTTMANMFFDATAFNQPLNSWNTSIVTTMFSMFNGAANFNQQLSSWNTASVTIMTYMFQNAAKFDQPINSWITTSVSNMDYMFANATVFNQYIRAWIITKIIVQPPTNFSTGSALTPTNNPFIPLPPITFYNYPWIVAGNSDSSANPVYTYNGTASSLITSPIPALITNQTFNRVIYTGTAWVAVGYYKTSANTIPCVMVSSDGTTWTMSWSGAYPLPGNYLFYDAYWDGSILVLVGIAGAGIIFMFNTSSNVSSTTWGGSSIAADAYQSRSLVAVVGNGDRWVAVGSATTSVGMRAYIITSTNIGIATWTESTYTMTNNMGTPISSNTDVMSIALLTNGLFMAATFNQVGTRFWAIYTSPDGNNWTWISTTNNSNVPKRIMMNNYANNTIFMATAQGVLYSTDNGLTWTTLISNSIGEILDIKMINSTTAIAVGYGSGNASLTYSINVNTLAYSTVTLASYPTNLGIRSVCSTYAPIYPVSPLVFGSTQVLTNKNTLVQYNGGSSYNIINYANYASQTSMNFYKITYTGNLWLAVGGGMSGGTSYNMYLASSSDGINWTQRVNGATSSNSPYEPAFKDVYWNGSIGVAVGSQGEMSPRIYYSTDMTQWNASTLPSLASPTDGRTIAGGEFNSVIYNGDIWVAAGTVIMANSSGSSVIFMTSSDGINWTQSTTQLYTIAISGGISPRLALFEGTFILGATQTILTSPNGTDWTLIAQSGAGSGFAFLQNFYILSIMQMNNLIIVAGYDSVTTTYAYYSSNKGATWTGIAYNNAGYNIYNIYDMKMISPTIAMMVGNAGYIPITLISTNGTTWTRINNGYTAATNQKNIRTFSGTYSEFVLDNVIVNINNKSTISSSNLSIGNAYTSTINAIPTYLYIPYANVTFPTGTTSIQISITLTQQSSPGATVTPVATGTFTMLSANKATYMTTGISVPLTLAQSNTYIISGYNVNYTLSATSAAIGTGTIEVYYRIGLVATLHGRTYFLPSTLTLPTATSAGTQWYIPNPVTYIASKTVFGNFITTSVPTTAANGLITYTTTTTPTGTGTGYSVTLAQNNSVNPSAQMLQLTLGSVANATYNVIASYAGNYAYAATTATQTVYTKNYIPASPATAVFFNKSGYYVNSSNEIVTIESGIFGQRFGTVTNSGLSVTINITDNVTINEFNFGYQSILGIAGYATTSNGRTFTMTITTGNTNTIITTVTFTTFLPPTGAQGMMATTASMGRQYYAGTYNQNIANGGYNDGTLMSIPFYDITGSLPTYVTSFSVTGTPSPKLILGDVIKITLTCDGNAAAQACSAVDSSICGALIATPFTSTPTNIYNNGLSSIVYQGNATTTVTVSPAGVIGSCPSKTISMKTMVTGLYIESMKSNSGNNPFYKLNVVNGTNTVLTVNLKITLYSVQFLTVFIPFSYASKQYNADTTTAIIDSISFSGTQNPIFEIGSTFSCNLVNANASNASSETYTYTSTGSNNSQFVAQAYGIQIQPSNLALDGNGVTVKYTGSSTLSSVPTFIYANPRGTGVEWFAVVNQTSKSMITNYAANLTSGLGLTYFTTSGNVVPFNNIVTTLLTDASTLFDSVGAFNQPIASWDTANVVNMGQMFTGATAFNGSIGSWNTAKVTNMLSMFLSANAFNQPLSSWNTANVVNMGQMFSFTAFNQNISSWNVTSVTDHSGFSTNCPLTLANSPGWSLLGLVNGGTVKYLGDSGLNAVPTFVYENPRNNASGKEWFAVVSQSFKSNITNYASNPWAYAGIFTKNGNVVPFNNIVTTLLTDMTGLFGSIQFFNDPIASWDTSNVTTMSNMFAGATAFNGYITGWNTANVTTMSNMFTQATAFNQSLYWNTANVLDMSNMFQGATAFDQPIGSWNTTKVTTMETMFSSASKYNQPLFSWNTANVLTMNYMFQNATSFNQYIKTWNVTKVGGNHGAFATNCPLANVNAPDFIY